MALKVEVKEGLRWWVGRKGVLLLRRKVKPLVCSSVSQLVAHDSKVGRGAILIGSRLCGQSLHPNFFFF